MCGKAELCYRVLLWGDCDGQTDQRSEEGHPSASGRWILAWRLCPSYALSCLPKNHLGRAWQTLRVVI